MTAPEVADHVTIAQLRELTARVERLSERIDRHLATCPAAEKEDPPAA